MDYTLPHTHMPIYPCALMKISDLPSPDVEVHTKVSPGLVCLIKES